MRFYVAELFKKTIKNAQNFACNDDQNNDRLSMMFVCEFRVKKTTEVSCFFTPLNQGVIYFDMIVVLSISFRIFGDFENKIASVFEQFSFNFQL